MNKNFSFKLNLKKKNHHQNPTPLHSFFSKDFFFELNFLNIFFLINLK